jgi:DNA-binding beta-propeller fold protein YncE
MGAVKPPKFVDCISGDTNAGKPSLGGSGNCTLIPSAIANGFNSGLGTPLAVAISADGRSVYTADWGDDAVTEFRRSKTSGKLTYMGCISGNKQLGPAGSEACKMIPSKTLDGSASGLDGPRGIVVSDDGKSVYVAAGAGNDDAVATFERSKTTGRLKYIACITGNTAAGPLGGGGSGACDSVPHAAANGADSGLDRVRDLIVSANGKSVYGVAGGDADVFRFARSGSGDLTFKGCITGDTAVAGAGSGACKALPVATSGGAKSGLADPEFVVLSPDDKYVYVSSRLDSAVATFRRSRDTGRISFQRCLTGSVLVGPLGGGGSGACHTIDSASASGVASGLSNPYALATSADGRFLYVVSNGDHAVATLKRSRDSGKVAFQRCITGNLAAGPVSGAGSGACKAAPSATADGDHSGFSNESSIALHGNEVVTMASDDSAANRFKRSKKTGRLSYKGCITSDPLVGPAGGGGTGACRAMPRIGPNSGINAATYLVLSPDGQDVYVAGAGNDAVTRLAP